MTDGTSQGLFVVVAIVIFGIFVALSYTVFGNNGMGGGISNLFSESLDTVSLAVVNPLAIDKTDNQDGTYTLRAYNRNESLDIVDMSMVSKTPGQNLLRNSDFTESLDLGYEKYGVEWITRNNVELSIDENMQLAYANPSLRVDVGVFDRRPDFYTRMNRSIDIGDTITISFYAKTLDRNMDLDIRFGVNSGSGAQIYRHVELTPDVQRFEITLTKQPNQTNSIIFEPEGLSTLWMSNIQVEYGDSATEWSPLALDNHYRTDVGYLEMVASNKGIYQFTMRDSEGNTYENEIEI